MEIITKINWVDVLVIILMLRISYVAFQAGLSHEIFPLIASILVVVVGLHYYNKIGLFISQNLFNMPVEVSNFISYLILVLAIGFISKLIKSVLDKVVKVQWHPLIERFGGLAFGMMRAAIASSLVLITIVLAPLPYLQWSIRDRSFIGMHFLKVGPNIYCRVSRFLPTLKVEGPSIDKETMLQNLVSDKSIAPKAKSEDKKKGPEWED